MHLLVGWFCVKEQKENTPSFTLPDVTVAGRSLPLLIFLWWATRMTLKISCTCLCSHHTVLHQQVQKCSGPVVSMRLFSFFFVGNNFQFARLGIHWTKIVRGGVLASYWYRVNIVVLWGFLRDQQDWLPEPASSEWGPNVVFMHFALWLCCQLP